MSTFSDSYIAANASNFPAEAIPALRQRLEGLDESQTSYVLATELKNPTTALIFSILLGGFGADRFYIGQIGLGVAKLLFSWLTFGIWPLVDWFLIMGAAKRANLERINMALMAASYSRQ
ncbi:TM2 domain-containing protein [Streptococcus cuniculi]|uniref:TM2 domain-containing protein n=1 Tax=Streptococcus cuniculi TaxID=1432788 RepID=A0A4Y9JFD9_9STRE|nr:TM2 domain-containing protein [Streptococcus cuniculi]MBF0777389.1 TM2 domain-containing protein [Streptococcus cuniculi]TFU98988.1 TM2 domain-containing protein [Streptococcus cuniculi]